jgi:ketosteroid isomerase-like protein
MKRKGLTLLLATALAAVIIPLAPVPGAADDGETEVKGMVAEAFRMEQMFVELWNAERWDQLGPAYYTEDAIAVPPNHEPIKGRAAIIEYMKGARAVLGEAVVTEPHNATASGNLVSLVGQYSGRDGKMRVTAHEVYERQADGSLRCTVDMFGFRDPLS